MFAIILLPVMGIAGLGIDLGLTYSVLRIGQSAADNAALSGAMEVAAGKGVDGGPATTDIQNLGLWGARNNLPGTMASNLTVATACTTPAANVICINNPPLLGPFASAGTIPASFNTNNTSDFVEAIRVRLK